MAIPTGFFDGVVADIGRTYSLKDADGYDMERDPVVSVCVRLAYQQICSFAKTVFHRSVYTVCYDEIFRPISLMINPIDQNEAITVEVDRVVQASTDWCLWNGVLYLSTEPDMDACYGEGRWVKMTATAGELVVPEESGLYMALMLQGIVNYNRRDILGFTQISGEKGVSRSVSDKGTLIDAVKDLIQPYVYYGNGRLCT